MRGEEDEEEEEDEDEEERGKMVFVLNGAASRNQVACNRFSL
jgi:hypothetical protein